MMYWKTLRLGYSKIIQLKLMRKTPKTEIQFQDFIESEMKYDDDGIYYGEL